MMEPYEWRDVEVTYPDWTGTAQLDQRMTTRGIEEVVGLDPDRWTVVGIDVGGGECEHDLHVVAVDRALFPERSADSAFPQIAAANGGVVPATDFLVHSVDPYKVLRAITHVFELRLRTRGTQEIPIQITALSDAPEGWTQPE